MELALHILFGSGPAMNGLSLAWDDIGLKCFLSISSKSRSTTCRARATLPIHRRFISSRALNDEFVRDLLRANNVVERDLSLYFHLPFCQTMCWYCGCNTVITKNQSQSAKYSWIPLERDAARIAPW